MDVEQNNRERSEIWALFWLSRKREKKENIMWAQDCVKSDNIWYIYNFVSFEGKNIGEWIYGLIWISNGVSLTKKGCVCLSVCLSVCHRTILNHQKYTFKCPQSVWWLWFKYLNAPSQGRGSLHISFAEVMILVIYMLFVTQDSQHHYHDKTYWDRRTHRHSGLSLRISEVVPRLSLPIKGCVRVYVSHILSCNHYNKPAYAVTQN